MAVCETCADALDDTSALTLADHVCDDSAHCACECRRQALQTPARPADTTDEEVTN